MLGTDAYPITLAEMSTYSEDADKLFGCDEHDRLKEFLAVHPEGGDVIPGTSGVRQLLWPIGSAEAEGEARIIYYFRDLNMPIYLLAVFRAEDRIEFDEEFCGRVSELVAELVEEHSKRWSHVARLDRGAQSSKQKSKGD